MAQRMQMTTPFKSGGNSSEHEKSGEKAPVKFKMAQTRNIGQPDPLVQVLVHPPREFSDTQHFFKRPVKGKGVNYNPAGEFGRPTMGPLNKTKATSLSGHSSRPGDNAVGKNSNRKGDNALGKAMNKVGSNVLGRPQNKKGQNAVPGR